MSQAQLPYVLLYLCSTFLSAVSQVFLKKAALREHKSVLAEYTDWRRSEEHTSELQSR